MKEKSNKTLMGTGLLTALAASLCCVTPVLALIAGGSGLAASLSWLEPLRPYLIGISLAVLALAWYQKIKPAKEDEVSCACESGEKPNFWQSKKLLGIITVLAALMLAFPYYSGIFYTKAKPETAYINPLNIQTIELDVEGMSCKACNFEVQHAAEEAGGVIEAAVDYKTGKAIIKIDKTKGDIHKVAQSIEEKTPYKIINNKILNQ